MTSTAQRSRPGSLVRRAAVVGPVGCLAAAVGWAIGLGLAATPAPTPTPATPAPPPGPGPVVMLGQVQHGALKVEPELLDLGTILEGAEATAQFTLTNTGADEIKILRAAPS